MNSSEMPAAPVAGLDLVADQEGAVAAHTRFTMLLTMIRPA
jgi:hypothetical protein